MSRTVPSETYVHSAWRGAHHRATGQGVGNVRLFCSRFQILRFRDSCRSRGVSLAGTEMWQWAMAIIKVNREDFKRWVLRATVANIMDMQARPFLVHIDLSGKISSSGPYGSAAGNNSLSRSISYAAIQGVPGTTNMARSRFSEAAVREQVSALSGLYIDPRVDDANAQAEAAGHRIEWV